MKKTKVLWFTGLSGSGKTTISEILIKEFEKKGVTFKTFDGDDVRNKLHKHLGFTPKDIKEYNRLIMELCKNEVGKVDYILVPIISPFKESRENARNIFGDNFIEIFLDCSFDECKKRDVKGLYKKAENGTLNNFIGLHVPYEKPETPEILIKTAGEDPIKSSNKIKEYLGI